jgi:AAA15 family ATPase/GTPase
MDMRNDEKHVVYLLTFAADGLICMECNGLFVFMLIKFQVENFRSFGEEVEFSCLATPERAHRERIVVGPQPGLRLLTVGAIYGANASGKSNLYRAVEFARDLLVTGVKLEAPIPVQPFRLNSAMLSAPARFQFQVLLEGKVLAYRFGVTAAEVVEESLTEIRPASDRLLFSRNAGKESEPKWNLEHFDGLGLKAEELQFIQFVAKGTPKNQLFLREAHARNLKHFEDLWKWFRHSLLLIDPETKAGGLEFNLEGQAFREFSARMLRGADVGIDRLGTKVEALESIDLPKEVKMMLEDDCKEGEGILLHGSDGQRISLRRKNGEIKAAKLVSYHRVGTAEPVEFDIAEESDGTRRVIDLLPAFHDLANPSSALVVFVDELDRSLHSRLTRGLIEGYLAGRPAKARSQLLFTTHDATLLDQNLFRNDEVSLMDKNEEGESRLSSLGDFKLRSDKRLMKDYLLGRFGGVPNLHRLPARAALAGAANECDQKAG